MRRPRTLLPLGLLLVLALAGLGLSEAHLALNFTPSLPLGLYHRADLLLEHGALVSVCVPEHIAREARQQGILAAGHCPGGAVPLLKRIAAAGGEVVEVTAEGVIVSGRQIQPAAQDRSSRGKPLTTWPLGRYHLGPDQLWLTADHPRSWDSRYFGPIDADAVLGAYRPLWTCPLWAWK